MKPKEEGAAMAAPDIKAIIFDCFGVIYSGSAQTLFNLSPEDRSGQILNVTRQYDHGWLTHEEFIEAIATIVDKSKQEISDYINKMHVRDETIVNYAKELKAANYKIGLLSNVGETTMEKLFTPEELATIFDDVLLSYEVHLAKPEPAIFAMAADRLHLQPAECVMIDDSQSNIDGAIAAGMKAIRYEDLHQLKRDLTTLLEGE